MTQVKPLPEVLIALGITTSYNDGGLTPYDRLSLRANDDSGHDWGFDADDAQEIVQQIDRLAAEVFSGRLVPAPAVPDDVARLATDCRSAAKIMAKLDTFPTGQEILQDAADTIEAQATELDALRKLLAEAREWNWIDFMEDKGAGVEVETFLPELTRLDAAISAALTPTGD